MRGSEHKQSKLFHHFSVEECIPTSHPIRTIRSVCDEALVRLYLVFEAMYSERGRPSIAPEALLKSQVLQALYSVRSDRLFCEMVGYNILFRWFLGMRDKEKERSISSHRYKKVPIEREGLLRSCQAFLYMRLLRGLLQTFRSI